MLRRCWVGHPGGVISERTSSWWNRQLWNVARGSITTDNALVRPRPSDLTQMASTIAWAVPGALVRALFAVGFGAGVDTLAVTSSEYSVRLDAKTSTNQAGRLPRPDHVRPLSFQYLGSPPCLGV